MNRSLNSNKWNNWLLAVLLFLPMVNYYIAVIYQSYGGVNPYSHIFYAIIYGCGALTYVNGMSVKKTTSVFIVLFILLLSTVITPDIIPAITGPIFIQSLIVGLLFIYVPIYLLASDIKFNYDTAFPLFYKCSLWVSFLCIIAYVCQVFLSGHGLSEYMTFAYTGLPAILFSVYFSWINKTSGLLGRTISSISVLTIIFGGCRGAILTLVLFIILIVLFEIKSFVKKIAIIFLSAFIYLRFFDILLYLNPIFEQFGYENRVVRLLNSNELEKSDGRMLVYKKVLSIIDINGHGLYSDRILLENINDATYCHNWILELLVDFGWIIGLLIIGIILLGTLKSVKTAISSKSVNYNFMMCFAVVMLSVKYMLSSSYLNSPELAFVFGWYAYQASSRINVKKL